MENVGAWKGPASELLDRLNVQENGRGHSYITRSAAWPKHPNKLGSKLAEIVPNLKEVGIIFSRELDRHNNRYEIVLVNQHWKPDSDSEPKKSTSAEKEAADCLEGREENKMNLRVSTVLEKWNPRKQPSPFFRLLLSYSNINLVLIMQELVIVHNILKKLFLRGSARVLEGRFPRFVLRILANLWENE